MHCRLQRNPPTLRKLEVRPQAQRAFFLPQAQVDLALASRATLLASVLIRRKSLHPTKLAARLATHPLRSSSPTKGPGAARGGERVFTAWLPAPRRTTGAGLRTRLIVAVERPSRLKASKGSSMESSTVETAPVVSTPNSVPDGEVERDTRWLVVSRRLGVSCISPSEESSALNAKDISAAMGQGNWNRQCKSYSGRDTCR